MNYNIFIIFQLQITNVFPVLPISWLNGGLFRVMNIYYGKGWLHHLSQLSQYSYLKLHHYSSWPNLNCWFKETKAVGTNRKKKKKIGPKCPCSVVIILLCLIIFFCNICVPSILLVSILITLVPSLQSYSCFTGLIPIGPTEGYFILCLTLIIGQ